MPGVSSSWNEANSTTPWGSEGPVAYGVVMSLILTTGLAGNILTIIVLMRREHRSKVITPFMINVAVLDLIIIALGYPVAIIANFTGIRMKEGDSRCQWTAFINGATGIAAIITLTAMSIVMRNTITHPIVKKRLSCKYLFGSLCAIWTYGILTMLPPLVGWSKFVPGAAKVSCGPDWETQNASTLSYNIVLLIVGFVIPVGIISACYLNIFRFLRSQPVPPAFISITSQRRRAHLRIARMILVSIISFVISWSPYCVVSVIAMVQRAPALSQGFAEIPELMAKASVVYNPLVFTVMNRGFRRSLCRIVRCLGCSVGHGISRRDGLYIWLGMKDLTDRSSVISNVAVKKR
uniref:Opsin n=1 Tax=Nematostella vectensis TaxID=45351 RepID=A9UMY9_NEMVE|nr:TPA: opsin [Nematostella vectensis]